MCFEVRDLLMKKSHIVLWFAPKRIAPALAIGLILSLLGATLRAEDQPRRPKDFHPFHYRYSIEQLQHQFSAATMKRAAAEVRELEATNAQGPWKPTFASLDAHPLPEWFQDAKFGLFIDWGPWSVAGWAPRNPNGATYPDWYEKNGVGSAYHKKVWGADFRRDDLLPLLTGRDFDAAAYARLARENGARYVVPFCLHHGGWALWNSSFTQRNAVQMGPKRDVYGALVKACREQGLRIGLYFSLGEWEYPVIGPNGTLQTWEWGKITPQFDSAKMNGECSGKIPVSDYVTQYLMPVFKEAVDHYDPDIAWFDGEWGRPAAFWRSLDLTAYFYNHAAGRKQVIVNDRLGEGTRRHHGDVYTSEFMEIRGALPHKWEENRSISHSYGYNWQDTASNVLSGAALVDLFVRTVADNGNLLLLISPTGSGRLPSIQRDRLEDLGAWLKVNGEAIYATRPQPPYKDGETVCYTRSKDHRAVYAILLRWPGKQVVLRSVRAHPGSEIRMLGVEQPLAWRQDDAGLTIRLPDSLQAEMARPCRYAWALRIPQASP